MASAVSTIIIGGGPAGLGAAISCGQGSLLLERNPFAGNKLLLSGSGQCNFTNALDRTEFLKVCGKNYAFLKPAFYLMDNVKFRELVEKAGCPTLARPDGKVFPASLRAEDVRNALLGSAVQAGARLVFNARVASVRRQDRFFVETADKSIYQAERLILAGGGSSWPQTGSDGSAYALARSLGHLIVAPRPALASVRIKGFGFFKACAGVSVKQAEAVFYAQGARIRARGDVLWTHEGLSGPLILDHSHLLGRGDRIVLNLLPRAAERVAEVIRLHPRQALLQALKRFQIPESLLSAILVSAAIDPGQICSAVTRDTRNRLVEQLSGLTFTIAEVESLRTAMATSGGIPLSEIKARSLESKLCSGLYCAGEILDYNLPTGGFNIQMAFSTGWLAGLGLH